MRLLFIILLVFLINLHIWNASDCAFWLCSVHSDIVWNTNENAKYTVIQIVKYFLWFLALVSIAFVIKWGFQIMSASGDDDKLKKWRRTIIFALIWTFIIINAYYFVSVAFQAWEWIDKI